MTDLTEQWKKGELPCGWYYIKIADIVFIDFFEGKVWKNKKDEYIDKVLAPVPSYDELQNMNKAVNECMAANIKLVEQNAQLKELLKECRNILKEQNFYRNTPVETDTTYRTRCLRKQELLTKIDEALR